MAARPPPRLLQFVAAHFPASRSGAVASLLLAIASMQFGASLAKSLFPAVGAQGAAALRLFFAAAILLILFRPWRTPIDRRAWPALAVYGASLGVMNLLFYLALQRVPLGVTVGLEFTGPMVLAILSSRRLIDFAWLALTIGGLLLLLPFGHATAIDPLGAAYALAAGASWAVYMVLGQKIGAEDTVTKAAWGMLIAATVVVPVGLAQAGSALFVLRLLPLAVTVALLSSALPYTIEILALQRMPVRTFSILMSLEPAMGALSGWLLLDESLSPVQCLAVLAIVIASLGTTLSIPDDRTAVPIAKDA